MLKEDLEEEEYRVHKVRKEAVEVQEDKVRKELQDHKDLLQIED